jgi:hypothetical protein
VEKEVGGACNMNSGEEECIYYIVLYCIYSAFKTSMKRIQNIVNIQHTDNNKYIKFKLLNIILKIKLKI